MEEIDEQLWARFQALRQRIQSYVHERIQDGDHHKSYEGRMEVSFCYPSCFDSKSSVRMRQLIIARKDLQMSPGKLAAQVSHASMAFIADMLRKGGVDEELSLDTCEIEAYHISVTMPPEIYNDWLYGIFTKTICEAKNRNHMMKAVTIAEELGLQEGKDFFLIKDSCLTELEPEEYDRAMRYSSLSIRRASA